MSDYEILKLFLQRDESAIEQTRARYGDKCMQIACGILKNRQDAEEVVSDSYLSLWKLTEYQVPKSLPAFLYRIVRNQALTRYDAINAGKRRAAEAIPLSELEDCIPSGTDTHTQYEGRELSQIINSFLRGRPEQDRRIFICRYFSGMDVKDIAKKYGVGSSRVKMSLLRSRKKLKEILSKEGYYNE